MYGVVAILLGMLVTDVLSSRAIALRPRYALHQAIAKLNPFEPQRRVEVVHIGDEEYWAEELARRTPLRRDYLGRLLCAVAAANPAVIAADFDMRSPDVTGRVRYLNAYADETRLLLHSIAAVATRVPIVLTTATGRNREGGLRIESSVWDGFDFGEAAASGAVHRAENCEPPSDAPPQVSAGYIALLHDVRFVPGRKPLARGGNVDSFSRVIVEAYARGAGAERPSHPEMIGAFAPIEDFRMGREPIFAGRSSPDPRARSHR